MSGDGEARIELGELAAWRHAEFVRGFDLAMHHKPLPPDRASPPAKRGYIDALSVSMPAPVRSTVRRLLSEGMPWER